MNISTWTSLIFFLLFVAPGLFFDLLSRRRKVAVDESTFQEAGRVALSSVLFGMLGTPAALGYLWLTQRGQVSNLGRIFVADSSYIEAHAWTVIGVVATYVITSLMAAWIVDWLIVRRHGAPLTPTRSIWTEVFRESRPSGTQPYIRATTLSGDLWEGVVGHFTADLEASGRELVLFAPISHGTRSTNTVELVPEAQRVVLQGDQVESISVRYAVYDLAAVGSSPG